MQISTSLLSGDLMASEQALPSARLGSVSE